MDRTTKIAAGTLAGAGAAIAAAKTAIDRRNGEDDDERSGTYELWRDEALPDGIRRIAEGRTSDALEQLSDEIRQDAPTAVHEARKDLKKIRSLLRLVRDDLGDDLYRRENVRFRDAGRLLSGSRDATVKLETLHTLERHFPGRFRGDEMAAFSAALQDERDVSGIEGATLEHAIAEVRAGDAAIADWPLDVDDWSLIEPGLRRAYRRGRDRFADVRQEASDEAVHEWRKRVKDLWYQLRIVRNAWPEVLGETADQAHELSDLLGDHHDLAVVRDDALARRDLLPGGELEKLLAAISDRQDELAGDAIRLGSRVYAEKPKAFVKRLRSYWSAWR